MMSEKTIISASTLIGSLSAYFYAKNAQKDTLPKVMIGGFIGALVGEIILQSLKEKSVVQKKS